MNPAPSAAPRTPRPYSIDGFMATTAYGGASFSADDHVYVRALDCSESEE